MDTTHAASRSTPVSWHHVRVGALLGVVAAVVMGVFAMIASATYHDTGFFTPLHHIASALIEPTAMMRSMEAGMAGDTFAISVGPALLGLALHLATGAFWGAIFGLIVSTGWLRGVTGLVAGIVYGLAVMVVMAFLALPVIAAVFGGGEPISDMPRLAGWGTFAIEHAIYGAVLGLWPLLRGPELGPRRPAEAPGV
jgi:predicted secreted protein